MENLHKAISAIYANANTIDGNGEEDIQVHDKDNNKLTIDWTQVNAWVDPEQYIIDREYPNIGDQLDMQYWDLINGTTTWKDAITQVKAAKPKPTE